MRRVPVGRARSAGRSGRVGRGSAGRRARARDRGVRPRAADGVTAYRSRLRYVGIREPAVPRRSACRAWPPSTAGPTRSGCWSPTSVPAPTAPRAARRAPREAGRPARAGRRRHRRCWPPRRWSAPGGALVDYAKVLRRKGTERVRMVATSATRDAAQPRRLLRHGPRHARRGRRGDLRRRGGARCRSSARSAISTRTTARSSWSTWAAARPSWWSARSSDGAPAVHAARSVDIGSVRLTERCLPGDPPTADEIAKAREVAAGILDQAFAAVPVEGVRTWVGVAGTITTLSAVAQRLPAYDPDGSAPVPALPRRPAPGGRRAARDDPRRARRATAASTPAGST